MVIVAWLRPPGPLQAGIVGLTLVDAAGYDWTGGSAPVHVRHNALMAAVRILDLELSQQRRAVTIDIAPAAMETEATAIPAIAQRCAQRVGPRNKLRRHVKGLVAQTVIIARPAWRQDVIAHRFAIDLRCVDAQRRDIQTGLDDVWPNCKLAAQKRAGLEAGGIFVPVRRHEGCIPVAWMEQAGLDRGKFAPCRNPVIDAGHPHAHLHLFPGAQGREGPSEQHRTVGFDPTRLVAQRTVDPIKFDFILCLPPLGCGGVDLP